MQIGIIGAGMIGGTLAELWTRAGHDVVVSSRHPEALGTLVARLGPRACKGTPAEAAAFGDVVLLAIPFGATASLPEDVRAALAGKVVIDAGNPFERRDGQAAIDVADSGEGSATWTARQLPGARVVKAFNTVHFRTMAGEAHRAGDRVGVPVAGDDPHALDVACGLIADAGLDPVLVGPLVRAAAFDPGTPAWNSGMTGAALRRLFEVR